MDLPLPGWMLLWLLLTSLLLVVLTLLVWWLARLLGDVKDELASLVAQEWQRESADLWHRQHQQGLPAPRTQARTKGANPVTLEERANLIDQRARESYYHGAYCDLVPALALQMLQEAVLEERERCAKMADERAADLAGTESDAVAAAMATAVSDIADAIRHHGGH